MERMLALCRKYNLSVTLACQTLGQTRVLQSALQNCLPVALRLGGLDAEWGAARVGVYDPSRVKATASGRPTFVSRAEQQAEWVERLERLPTRHAIVRLGEETVPFYTLGLPDARSVRGAEQALVLLKERYRQLLLHPAEPTETTDAASDAATATPEEAPNTGAWGSGVRLDRSVEQPVEQPLDRPMVPPRHAERGDPSVRRIIPWPGSERGKSSQ